MKTVFIGADHAGYKAKEEIKKALGGEYKFVDMGTDSEESVDYPGYGKKVAEKVASDKDSLGVLVCGSGIGICIAANKVKGIRCGLAWSAESARSAREHNNAQIISVAGRMPMMESPANIVRAFLEAKPSTEERHARRVKQMMEMEQKDDYDAC